MSVRHITIFAKMNKLLYVLFSLFTTGVVSLQDELLQDPNLFEGDIELRPDQMEGVLLSSSGIPAYGALKDAKWPNPQSLPYEISDDLAKFQRAKDAIAAAIAELELNTCLRLRKKRAGENMGIIFTTGFGCSSPVGFSRYRPSNIIRLASGCWIKGIVVHEILHSLGFWHEQSRPDRDKFVTIKFENINLGYVSQFTKHSYQRIDSMGSPYDYDSVLHYGSYYFSANGKKTIETKNIKDQRRIGQRRGMSPQDIWQVNKMYCGDTNLTPKPPSTPPSTPTTSRQKLFCIKHYGGKYVTVGSNGRTIQLENKCTSRFTFVENKALKLAGSDFCMEPQSSHDNSFIILKKGCGSNARFSSTEAKSLRHLNSGKCVHPYKGAANPTSGTKLVIYNGCNEQRLNFYFVESTNTTPKPPSTPPSTPTTSRQKLFCIKHYGGKYVTVGSNGRTIQLENKCTSRFTFVENKALKLAGSDFCMEPQSSHDNSFIILKKGCGSNARFSSTEAKSLRHLNSGKCVHPYNGAANPTPGTKLVIYNGCNEQRLNFYFVEK